MAEPKEVTPGTFALRAYIGRSATGSAQFLHETYRHPRPDGGIQEARRRQRALEVRAKSMKTEGATLGGLLDRWLRHAETIGRAPNTVAGYTWRVKVIKDATIDVANHRTGSVSHVNLGAIRLDKLTAGHLDAWYGQLLTAGKTPADIKAYHRVIGAALAQGEKWETNEKNVARKASPPRVSPFKMTPPTPGEVETLIRLAIESRSDELDSVIAWLAISGMRRGEVCALRWSDVDWNEAEVHVSRSIYQNNTAMGDKDTKTHQERDVSFGPVGVALLEARELRAKANAAAVGLPLHHDAYIWSSDPVGAEPLHPDRITQAFNRLCRKAEKPARDAAKREGRELRESERWNFRLHDLRHYSATTLLSEGVNVVAVARRLGHAKPSTTSDIYGHALKADDKKAAEILGRSFLTGPNELTA